VFVKQTSFGRSAVVRYGAGTFAAFVTAAIIGYASPAYAEDAVSSDISITASPPSSTLAVGTTVDVTLTISNAGPDDAITPGYGVLVGPGLEVVTVPAGCTTVTVGDVDAIVPDVTSDPSPPGGLVFVSAFVCPLASLTNGDTQTVTIPVKLTDGAAAGSGTGLYALAFDNAFFDDPPGASDPDDTNNSAVSEIAVKVVPTTTPPANGPQLPATGAKVGLVAGLGLAVVIIGLGFLMLGRTRRSRA
jgi:LPXTG-motif cell wall-anchored protein